MKHRNSQAVEIVPLERVEQRILVIRNQRVLVDADLAELYGVPTKRLNQQVKRNASRFPPDFVFQLTKKEKMEVVTNCNHLTRLRYSPVLPYVFTEHGAIMAANVLSSPQAVTMSVFVVRAFVKMREALGHNRELAEQLAELERRLTQRLDVHEQAIVHVLGEIRKLMEPPPVSQPPRREIGFHAKPSASARPDAKGKRK